MGTRHCIIAVCDGEHKIAQYGQWDGYPTGQGYTIADFIQKEMDEDVFRTALRECRYIGEEAYKALWLVEVGADLESQKGTVTLDQSHRFLRRHPQFHRDVGAGILSMVQGGVRVLRDCSDFVRDSLFCEWAYVIDMDSREVEVYEGFNKSPVPAGERFSDPDSCSGKAEYFPVRLVAKAPFEEVTREWMDKVAKRRSKNRTS